MCARAHCTYTHTHTHYVGNGCGNNLELGFFLRDDVRRRVGVVVVVLLLATTGEGVWASGGTAAAALLDGGDGLVAASLDVVPISVALTCTALSLGPVLAAPLLVVLAIFLLGSLACVALRFCVAFWGAAAAAAGGGDVSVIVVDCTVGGG